VIIRTSYNYPGSPEFRACSIICRFRLFELVQITSSAILFRYRPYLFHRYLAGKLHLFNQRGHIYRVWIFLAPLWGALLIAISRYVQLYQLLTIALLNECDFPQDDGLPTSLARCHSGIARRACIILLCIRTILPTTVGSGLSYVHATPLTPGSPFSRDYPTEWTRCVS